MYCHTLSGRSPLQVGDPPFKWAPQIMWYLFIVIILCHGVYCMIILVHVVVAFLVALHQNKELLGSNGLLPIPLYLTRLRDYFEVHANNSL